MFLLFYCRTEKDTGVKDDTSGNCREDSLLDSLTFRNESGYFFRKFVTKQKNQV